MKKYVRVISHLLLIAGGLNWGCIGLFEFNVIDYVFRWLWIDGVIYFLIGVAGVYEIVLWWMKGKRLMPITTAAPAARRRRRRR